MPLTSNSVDYSCLRTCLLGAMRTGLRMNPAYSSCPGWFESGAQRQKLLLLVGASALILMGRTPTVFAQTTAASVTQRLQSQQLWVNPQTGSDAANGSEQAPFRTLTRALQTARANTVIQLAAGTYSTDTGELFPLMLKPGVTVQGNCDQLGHGIVIRGGGSYNSPSLGNQNVTLIGIGQATLAGVTVTNPNTRGHGLWVETGNPTIRDSTFINSANAGMVAAGSSTPLVQNNLFLLNRMGGLTVAGNAQPSVQGNTFQRTGTGLTIGDNAAPQVSNNRISQNRDGIVVQGNAQPLLRNNTIEDSEQDGVVVIAQAQPNLGTTNDPGNNVFLNSGQHDINALTTSQVLPAFGNQVASNGLAGKIDLSGNASLVSVTTVASTSDRLPITQATRVTVLPPSSSPSSSGSGSSSPISSLPPPPVESPISSPVSSPLQPARLTPQPSLIASLPPTRSAPANPSGSATNPSQPTNQAVLVSSTATVGTPAGTPAGIPTATSTATLITAEPRQAKPVTQPVLNPEVMSVLASPAPSPRRAPSAIPINVPRPDSATGTTSAAQINAAPVNSADSSRSAGISTQANATQPDPAQLASVTVTAATSLPRQNFATRAVSAPTLGGAPISIPVPPPERQQPVVIAAANSVASSPANSSPVTPPNANRLLPVPTGAIPLGNTGSMPRVSISGAQSGGTLVASSQNLQYRVVVAASDSQTESLVRSVVPDAFSTSINGQPMLQIGAFSTRENAQDAVEMLSRSGLTGIIQPMD